MAVSGMIGAVMVERMSNLLDSVGAEWILWLLLVLSVVSIAIIIERWIFLRRRKYISKRSHATAQAESSTEDMLTALGNGPAMELAVGRALVTIETDREKPSKTCTPPRLNERPVRTRRRLLGHLRIKLPLHWASRYSHRHHRGLCRIRSSRKRRKSSPAHYGQHFRGSGGYCCRLVRRNPSRHGI